MTSLPMVENIQSLYNLSMKVTASKEGTSLPERLNPTTSSTHILCVVWNNQIFTELIAMYRERVLNSATHSVVPNTYK